MKIVHIVESFAGGVYDFLVELTNALPEFEHLIIHGKRENTPTNFKKDFPKNTRFTFWENTQREINPKKDFQALVFLTKILKNTQSDIIHLHSSKAGFLGRLAARILKLQNKVVYTSHGVSFLREDISSFKKEQFILFEKFGYKLGGKVIACSKSEAKEFIKHGIEASYIYNGIKCYHNKNKEKEDNDTLIVGTIGRITYQKNPYLFNEIAKAFDNDKRVKFIWIGDGELKKILKSNNIQITGWISQNKVFDILSCLDIYISTSLWEGLPLSVLQAMCCRKPLILSNCIGNIDLVKNNFNGYIFENADDAISKIKNLLDDTKNLKYFGNNSYILFNNTFSLDNMIIGYRRLYEDLLEINTS